MIYGYMGKILFVNLSTGKISEEIPDESFYRKYIGGYGIGARILYDRIPAGADPLGPDNVLGLMTGPMTGVPGLQASRLMVVCKSPLTGAWADSNCGGYFAPFLKYAGYDAVFFSGISPIPVYLNIDDGKAELRDAAHLWGKDTTETEKDIKAELGSKVAVACIGPAAEKLSLITGVVHDEGCIAARNGVGAVMGSKKLKAVAVSGTQKVPIPDKEKVKAFSKKYVNEWMQGPTASILSEQGTCGFNTILLPMGDMPVKNWGGSFESDIPGGDATILDGEKFVKQQAKKHRCLGCVIGCKGHMKAGKEYDFPEGAHKPEYETCATFGTMCLNWNIESIIQANHLCNLYGLDTISAGSVIAFAIECFENGIITKEDTGGIELTWGNHQSIISILEKIGKREGFGDLLADGSKKASERIGRGSEKFVVNTCGQEPGMHDPRLNLEWLGAMICDSAPGRHTSGATSGDTTWNARIMDNLSVCMMHSYAYPTMDWAEMLNIATGWDIDMEEVKQSALRSCHLRQAFTAREGIKPKDLQFQDCRRPIADPAPESGPFKEMAVLDQDGYQKEFFGKLGWDLESGKPLRGSLITAGLEDVAKSLWE